MTHLKISVPVYKKGKWDSFHKKGKIEVTSDVDNLSEGYEALKNQIDKLLAELDASTRLAETARNMELEIEEKAHVLNSLKKDIERATQHYEDLKVFLTAWGVDQSAMWLTFDKRLLLSEASAAEVEVVSGDIDSEF